MEKVSSVVCRGVCVMDSSKREVVRIYEIKEVGQ